MKLWQIAARLIFVTAASAAAEGQEAAPATAAAPATVKIPDAPSSTTGTGKIAVREGTDVSLKFAQDLSSKTAAEDDPVNLVLAEVLKVGDVVIAKADRKRWERSRTRRRPA
jgi:hypothetical protein